MTSEKTVSDTCDPPHSPAADAAEVSGAAEEAAETFAERYHAASDIQILVLDDDQMICRLIRTALSHFDFTVQSASEARSIEKLVKKGPYQLVIMDYMIPGVQFEQLLDLVQQEQPNASVMVVTAFPTLDHALQCLRARIHDYLPKPFDVVTLNRTVLRCLESKGLLRLSEDALREMVGKAVRERRKALKL